MKLLIITIAVSMMTIEMALAAPTCIPVNGSITDSVSGNPITGAYVRNASNISAEATADSTDTTGADGFFNFTCMFANDAPGATAADYKLWVNASGYTEKVLALNLSVTNASYFGTAPGVVAARMTPITPVNGAVTVSSITKNSAVIAWTVNTPTDNVSNNYVDQVLKISASGVPNLTQAWTNSTLTNSYSVTNLLSNQVYTYYAIVYNTAHNALNDQDSATFTTLKAGVASSWTPEPTATPKKGIFDTITGGKKTAKQRNVIVVAVIAILAIIFYYGIINKPGGKRK